MAVMGMVAILACTLEMTYHPIYNMFSLLITTIYESAVVTKDFIDDWADGISKGLKKAKDLVKEIADEATKAIPKDVAIPKIPPYYSTEVYFSVKIDEHHVATVYYSSPLSKELAVIRVMSDGDVWAASEKAVIELCMELGGVLRGPERGHAKGALNPQHYHSVIGNGHIFFGYDSVAIAA
ncbi:MAG: hypothetical protein WC900_08145 [Oscillospiraceae bacterium]